MIKKYNMNENEYTAQNSCIPLVPQNISEDISEEDTNLFFRVTSTDLNERQIRQVTVPGQSYPRQKHVLAVHWHPEFVPFEHIEKRVHRMFPNMENELIIPTQHNQLMEYKGYSGVEVDCYSSGFNQKVQLLLHFKSENVKDAHILNEMLMHTFKYRSSQLFKFIHAITSPNESYINIAMAETGVTSAMVKFIRIYVKKIEKMLEMYFDRVSPLSVKNKLLRNYFDGLRKDYGDPLIDRVQTFLKAVKVQVKKDFSLSYFYRASEVIEEARKFKAGVVIPHPEEFWPVLLANYDVDGYEVWNPQSQRYTNFLISVLAEKNKQQGRSNRPLLVFMGDDTHMGEKTRKVEEQEFEKARREIGLQPAWDDLEIRKTLISLNINRKILIEEYKKRLNG